MIRLSKRGRRVQCSAVKVYVSSTTAGPTSTSRVIRTFTPTTTVNATITVYQPATRTPAPVLFTTTVDAGIWTESRVARITQTFSAQTSTLTVSKYASTTTSTKPAYRICEPTATAAFGSKIYKFINVAARSQAETSWGTIYSRAGQKIDPLVECCSLAAAVPGAVAWKYDFGDCSALNLQATSSDELVSQCVPSSNATVAEWIGGSARGGHAIAALLQCGSASLSVDAGAP